MSLSSPSLLSALLSTVIAATATATTLYFIYNSYPFQKKKPAKLREGRRLKAKLKRKTCGKILFVSQIGTSKAFAKRLCQFLASEESLRDRVYLELVDARNYEPEELPKENIVLLVASNRNSYLTDEAEDFGRWIQDNAENFGSGVFVVNACSFSVFGVGSSVSEGGKNLMAKAANRIRDLGSQAAKFEAAFYFDNLWQGVVAVLKGAASIRDLSQTAKFDAAFDFDNWWQGVVAVLKGAVLGDTVADGNCDQSEPEDYAGCCDPKRIYMLVENVDDRDRRRTYRRRMLTISEANFMKNGIIDLEDGGFVTAQWPLPDAVTSDSSLPFFEGFCSLIGFSLFFTGNIETGWNQRASDKATKMWCLKYDGSAWIWSLCRSIFFHSHELDTVIQYNGKLCIIGGKKWIDIYHPKSEFWEKREVPKSVLLRPHSCFLWETFIVLYSIDEGENQWLMSYDLNANIWSPIECNFPPVRHYQAWRKLVRLGCSDFLLIIDFVTIWYIYDLSKKEPVAIVHVNALDEIGSVSNVFCCHHTSKESMIYVFLDPAGIMDLEEGFTEPSNPINIVPYVRVKLQIDGDFSAEVESKGNLKVGPYLKHYIFAVGDQDIK